MADQRLTQILNINGIDYTLKDKNAVTKQQFQETLGDINSILDEINGEEV